MMSVYSEHGEPTVADEIRQRMDEWHRHQRMIVAAQDMAVALEWLLTEPTSEKGREMARTILDRVKGQ